MSDLTAIEPPDGYERAVAEPVRLGLIGFGRHGRQILLPTIQRCDGLRLMALATAGPATAAAARDRFGYPAVAGHDAVLARDDIEAVVIATPPAVQAEVTLAALRAGKHVLCETPGPRTPEELRAVRQAQSAANRVLDYGACLRHAPIYRHLRELMPEVRAGGRVVLTIRYYDALRHVVDLACFLGGEVARVVAWSPGQPRVGTVEFASGDLGIFHLGGPAHAGVPLETVEVAGAGGRLSATGSRELVAYCLPAATGVDDLAFASATATVWAPSGSMIYGALGPLVLRGYVPELEAFAAAVRQGTSDAAAVDRIEHALAVERAIERAVADDRPANVEPLGGERSERTR